MVRQLLSFLILGMFLLPVSSTRAEPSKLSVTLGIGISDNASVPESPWSSFTAQGTYQHNYLTLTLRHVRNIRIDLGISLGGNGGFRRHGDNNEWALLAGSCRHLSPSIDFIIAGGVGLMRGWNDGEIQYYDESGDPVRVGEGKYSVLGVGIQTGLYYRRLGMMLLSDINSGHSYAALQLCFRLGSY